MIPTCAARITHPLTQVALIAYFSVTAARGSSPTVRKGAANPASNTVYFSVHPQRPQNFVPEG